MQNAQDPLPWQNQEKQDGRIGREKDDKKMQDCVGQAARKGVTYGKSFANMLRKRYRKIGFPAANIDLTNVCP